MGPGSPWACGADTHGRPLEAGSDMRGGGGGASDRAVCCPRCGGHPAEINLQHTVEVEGEWRGQHHHHANTHTDANTPGACSTRSLQHTVEVEGEWRGQQEEAAGEGKGQQGGQGAGGARANAREGQVGGEDVGGAVVDQGCGDGGSGGTAVHSAEGGHGSLTGGVRGRECRSSGGNGNGASGGGGGTGCVPLALLPEPLRRLRGAREHFEVSGGGRRGPTVHCVLDPAG